MSKCVNYIEELKRGEQGEVMEDNHENAKGVGSHYFVTEKERSKAKRNPGTHNTGETTRSRFYKLIAVCLVLLSLLLLAAITVLCIKFPEEKNHLQTRYNNLALEKDKLQTKYTSLTVERDDLQTRHINLTIERNQLQTSYNTMAIERYQLQASYNNLAMEKAQLQTMYTNVTVERDELQTRHDNLTIERDQLQTSYNTMAKERYQLQASYNNLTMEKAQLETMYTNVTVERDELQTRHNNLTIERNQLQTRYNNLSIERNQLKRDMDSLKKNLLQMGWGFYNSSIYYISTEKTTWSKSREECKTRGADLVIINSKEEQVFISKQFGQTEAWIGLNDSVTEGAFKWVDGKELSINFWWSGEANDFGGNEDCAITGYTKAKSNVSTWADYPCSFSVVGICERVCCHV